MTNQSLHVDALEVDQAQWTQIRYPETFIPGYPEYVKLEISFRSTGRLPSDLERLYNYTDTVFIRRYDVSSNVPGINISVIRNNAWIGTEWFKLEFDVENEQVEGLDQLDMSIKLHPHNNSLTIIDTYSISIQFEREATIPEIIKSSVPLLVFMFLAFYIILWKKINSSTLDNLGYLSVPSFLIKNFFKKIRNKLFPIIVYLVTVDLFIRLNLYKISKKFVLRDENRKEMEDKYYKVKLKILRRNNQGKRNVIIHKIETGKNQ